MKFTDGFWQLRPGVEALYAQEAYDVWQTDRTPDGPGLVITAPTSVIAKRGDSLETHRATRHSLQRKELVDLLNECGGNIAEMARRLSLTRGAVVYRLQKHGLMR